MENIWRELRKVLRKFAHGFERLHMVGADESSTVFALLHFNKSVCITVEEKYICIG